MQLPSSLVLLILSAAQLAQGLPTPHRSAPRDINISHKSLATGTTTTHSINASVLPAELAKAIEGNEVNINLTTDRRKRSPLPQPAAGVSNSTINLTVISKRAKPAAQHHNIAIDASSDGKALGGIHNSTLNFNINSSGANKRQARRKVELGDHSVLVDVSSANAAASSSDAETAASGIEDSTVHVNILPARALAKSTGHHSIVVDSSSLGAAEVAQSSTTTGDHSAVVDTSASASSSGNSTTAAGSTGVKNSTINLTVVAAKEDQPAPAAAPAAVSAEPVTPVVDADTVDAPIPSLARLSKRASPAFEAWSKAIQQREVSSDLTADTDASSTASPVAAVEDNKAAAPQQSGFVVVRRTNHASKPATLSAKRA
ncbi:hypothetical protein JCM8097_001013 [Rhodosporidiobolus ruineniae]